MKALEVLKKMLEDFFTVAFVFLGAIAIMKMIPANQENQIPYTSTKKLSIPAGKCTYSELSWVCSECSIESVTLTGVCDILGGCDQFTYTLVGDDGIVDPPSKPADQASPRVQHHSRRYGHRCVRRLKPFVVALYICDLQYTS